MKKILFLSALDFKEKSIQVIRKTPEAYAKAGWDVDYIVARDNAPNGNYFYEEEIGVEGVSVKRIYWPFPNIRSRGNRYFKLLISKLATLLVVLKLFRNAKSMVGSKEYDVIYGYELHGVLAMRLLKYFVSKDIKFVSRFQGTFLNEMFTNKQYFRLLFNMDLIGAIKAQSDLIIMTDDGTQGDQAVKKIKRHDKYNMLFMTNGVDPLPQLRPSNIKKDSNKITLMSVSRLVGWKRVDRNINIISALKKLGVENVVYYILGDGEEKSRLKSQVKELDLEDNVVFVGALKHSEVISYLINADFFLSMYDSSNVGNPLLEALRANKLIVTLANGDTANWIQHMYNGMIYDPNNIDYLNIAKDIKSVIEDSRIRKTLLDNVKETERRKLYTWQERLAKEIEVVSCL